MTSWREEALNYHRHPVPGKIAIRTTKPCLTQRDLSLAYTPGVAEPCREIVRDPANADLYTSRANLVAVVTNGTAVLGLGDIGPLAGKPVMEGKAVLFKRFADIDVFDLEIDERDPERLADLIARLAPTFGGINLEDIRAPDCFVVLERLQAQVDVPVLHDDQHGTATILAAGLINALELQNKTLEDAQIVCVGAGAAGIACMRLLLKLGAKKENILLLDRKGVIHKGREDLNPYKAEFATDRPERTLAEAMRGADVFIGLSQGGIVSPEMLKTMAPRPIVFALANPEPEIAYDVAMSVRDDLVMATGRSDHPNQVNNVLGFPFLFRGALDARARAFTDEMFIAAARALAELARTPAPASVARAYNAKKLQFGKDYILPKPFDPRLIEVVPPAVAEAAVRSGVAQRKIEDLKQYRVELVRRVDPSREFLDWIYDKARAHPLRLVFPEGDDEVVLRAAEEIARLGIAQPIVIGARASVLDTAKAAGVDAEGFSIMDPFEEGSLIESLAEAYYFDRKRHGVLRDEAKRMLRRNPVLIGTMMVRRGFADGMLAGRTDHYPNVLRPVLRVLGHDEQGRRYRVYGMYMMLLENAAYFLADCTVNLEMDAEALAELAELAAEAAASLGVQPRVAMLSFSNFGSVERPETKRVAQAVRILHERRPDLVVDGEMQADTALDARLLALYPFSKLKEPANVLIFPTMQAGNIAYKLLKELGGATAIGPVLIGLPKQVHVLATGATVDEIVHLAAVASARAGE